jgi:hypothetical protein
MARQETMKTAAGQAQPGRLLKRPGDTQTAWEDPWSATKTARETTPHGAAVLREARPVGQRITEEINADPEEVERLRKARRDARDGKTFPRHSDTKSS